MNLFLSRSQHLGFFSLIPLRIGVGVVFRLRAELELDDEEWALIKRYQLTDALLVQGSKMAAFRRAIVSALIVGVAVFLGLLAFYSWQYGGWYPLYVLRESLPLPALITPVLVVVYYLSERDHITVGQLLQGGRTFHCDSVVDLIKKEAFLESISEYLRQVLESAKHWQDREVITIKPLDKAAAKRAVLQGA